jgi:hypothetical protein
MGSACSKYTGTGTGTDKLAIEQLWSGFLESCCILDKAEFTPLSVLETAFATYMREISDIPDTPINNNQITQASHWFMKSIYDKTTPGLSLSTGWEMVEYPQINTHLVVGIKIARIRPKSLMDR